MKEDILKNKNNESVCTYLQLLEDNIIRMGNNSFNVKSIIAIIETIIVTTLIETNTYHEFWWVCLIPSVIAIFVDAFYLGIERKYKTRYNKFFNDLNDGKLDVNKIYNLPPINTNLKYEKLAMTLSAVTSFSI